MREIKNLPDDEILDRLIESAKDFEQAAKDLYNLATDIDEKWRNKLKNRRKIAIEQLKAK